MTRIFCDFTDALTHLSQWDTVTGTQRVALTVAARMVEREGSDRVLGVARRPGDARMVELDLDGLGAALDRGLAVFAAECGVTRKTTIELEVYLDRKYPKRPMSRSFHRLRLSTLDRLGFGTLRRRGVTPANAPAPRGRRVRALSAREGDVVAVLGAMWNQDAHLEELASLRDGGVRLVVLIHDLIPLVAPHFVAGRHDEFFEQALGAVADMADLLLCNSEATRNDLAAFLDRRGKKVATAVTPLAHEFGHDAPPTENPIRAVSRDLAAELVRPFVLCVGTVDPRKNILGLFQVWASIAAELDLAAPRLVIAGRAGWLSERVMSSIRGSGFLNGKIHVEEKVSDEDLRYLYQNCLFTVFPSFIEGWGLPIGESLWNGKFCCASRSSSMPEVGGDLVDYFDPYDLEDMKKIILRPIVDRDYLRARETRIRQARLRSWDDVVGDVYSAIVAETQRVRARSVRAPTPESAAPASRAG